MIELPNNIESLTELVKQLLEESERLKEENERLRAENAELRRRLGLDSHHSHKPPSSDGYRKKSVKPGIPKEGRTSKNGGQPGHKGKTLERVEHPDEIQIHLPKRCQCCQRPFTTEETYEIIPSRQVFDLPKPKLEVIEHRLGQISCCGQRHRGSYPEEVTALVQYGPGVRALITKLSVDHNLPLEQISQLFEDIYGYDLNTKTIEEALERGYKWIAPLEKQIISRLKQEEQAHFDETGVRVAGKLYWMHTVATEQMTHLFIHEKRGLEALESEASILKDFKGMAMHDCWSPYFHYQSVRHLWCGAHLLRELYNRLENGSLWAEEMHRFLLALYRMPRPTTAGELVRLHYHLILEQADREEPPPQRNKRGKPKQSKGRNLLNRLREHEDGVLAFALEASVPFTHNQAQRDLRPIKVKQKVSGCFRTPRGAEVYARLRATISTCRKQGLNVFATWRDLFSCVPFGLA